MDEAVDEPDVDAAEIADVFAVLGNRTRLLALQGVMEEKSVQEIADGAGVTWNAVHQQIQRLIDAEFVYVDEEQDYRYQTTPVGQQAADAMAVAEVTVSLQHVVEAAEQQAREELESLLSGEALTQAVEQRKWTLVREEISEQFDGEVDTNKSE